MAKGIIRIQASRDSFAVSQAAYASQAVVLVIHLSLSGICHGDAAKAIRIQSGVFSIRFGKDLRQTMVDIQEVIEKGCVIPILPCPRVFP